MKILSYPADECDRYVTATGILGEVIAQCANLSYNVNDDQIQAAISEFETPYAIWRNTLKIADKEAVNRVYTEVKPLIDSKKITIEFILQHTRHANYAFAT